MILKVTALLVFPLLLCACQPKVYYQHPAALQKESAGSIVGTRIKTGALLADRRFYIATVDAAEVKDAEEYAEQPLPVPSGQHVLLARFEQASLWVDADFVVDVQPRQQIALVGRVLDENFLGHAEKVGFTLMDINSRIPLGPEIVKDVKMNTVVTYPVYVPK